MGSTGEAFCLKWNDFHSGITRGFSDIRAAHHLLDVTVRCGDSSLLAHRLILSSCSAWFREVLCSLPPAVQNPVVVLWDASPKDLEILLDFMYNGEVNVKQDRLNSFLALAERLQVRGLTQREGDQADDSGGTSNCKGSNEAVLKTTASGADSATCSSTFSHKSPGEQRRLSVLPPKRRRSTALKSPADEDDVQECIPAESNRVKMEASESQVQGELIQNTEEAYGDSYYDSYYEEPGGDEYLDSNQSLSSQQQQQNPPSNIIEATKGMATHGGNCPICFKFIVTNVRRHLEDLHFPTSTPCTVCGKVFSSNNKMRSHKAYAHRGAP